MSCLRYCTLGTTILRNVGQPRIDEGSQSDTRVSWRRIVGSQLRHKLVIVVLVIINCPVEWAIHRRARSMSLRIKGAGCCNLMIPCNLRPPAAWRLATDSTFIAMSNRPVFNKFIINYRKFIIFWSLESRLSSRNLILPPLFVSMRLVLCINNTHPCTWLCTKEIWRDAIEGELSLLKVQKLEVEVRSRVDNFLTVILKISQKLMD